MNRQTIELTEAPAEGRLLSPGNFALTASTKAVLLVALLGILYLRLWRRKRGRERICTHCGKHNSAHRTSCAKCATQLLAMP